jgi:hypothetical protein
MLIVFALYAMFSSFFGTAAKGNPGVYFGLLAAIVVFSGAVILFLRRKHLI